MNEGDYDGRRISSVKAAIKFLDAISSPKTYAESSSSASDFPFAKRNMSKYKGNKGDAEFAKALPESEILNARKSFGKHSFNIEELETKTKERIGGMEMLNESETELVVTSLDERQVVRELEIMKQELSKLKLDIAAVREVKLQAEKEIEASSSKLSVVSCSVQELKEEIENASDEQVFVELSRIEALKEYEQIEAQRKKESSEFMFKLEETKQKINEMIKEVDRARELENKLAVTLADINVLQNEMLMTRKLVANTKRRPSLNAEDLSLRKTEELEDSPILQPIMDELEAAKRELVSVKADSFRFMTSMDIVRSELKHVSEETARLKKIIEIGNPEIQNLESELLQTKSKLEAAFAAEEKSTTIVSSLTATLQKLNSETESARQEKALALRETEIHKKELPKIESEIFLTEEKLQAAIQILEAVKISEAAALEDLKNLTENTMRSRTAAYQDSSIVISKIEYSYLKNPAAGAEKMADKKVEAAQAWIKSLKASEREIMMKCEMTRRQINGMRVEEEKEVYQTERSLSRKRMLERQMNNLGKPSRQSSKAMTPKRTPSRGGKFRASPAYRMAPSGSFAVKKTTVIPNLSKFFNGKRNKKHSKLSEEIFGIGY
ncbi:hypothetical protein ACFE04_010429 [Oxalis oulophora]